MTASPTPTVEESRANAVFEALIWAMSRPGMPRSMPEAGETQIIDALLDRECRAHASDPRLIPVILRSGAEIAEVKDADHVFLGVLEQLDILKQVSIGDDIYPDSGATVILRVSLDQGERLRFTGPGVKGHVDVTIGGLPRGFWTLREDIMRYPMGFDLVLMDGTQVVGVPRSTQVEVL